MKTMFSAMKEKGRCSSYSHWCFRHGSHLRLHDAPDGSPAREIAMVLLVGIPCIELVGRNELVVKVQVNMAARLYKALPLNA